MEKIIKIKQKELENIVETMLSGNEIDTELGNEEEIKEEDTNNIPYGIYLGNIKIDNEGNEIILIKSGEKIHKLGDLI